MTHIPSYVRGLQVAVLDLFKFDGKVALVTGAGSGIGRAYVEALSVMVGAQEAPVPNP